MQETQEKWVWSLGQEDLLEKEMATHSSILTWQIPWAPMGRGAWWTTVQRLAKSWTWLSTHTYIYIYNWMERSRKVSFARQELWSASLIVSFFLLVNPTFFLWSTWDGRFSDSSVVKESTCKAGGPCSISGLGRSTEEGISYLLNILGLPCWLSW